MVAEVDFVVQHSSQIIPIEVKAEETLRLKVCGRIMISLNLIKSSEPQCQIIVNKIG